ncbi:zinc-dependent alcohol dehydrogenase family protein [Pseudomonas abietaniphila]|uniref:NADPH:quinone reductase n=1 Tax=Pseudomonas abietaniphila TaxID=89065 RepID=A0A1G8PVZ4_9PSED|nr:zinc-dependent alcohol dehydrogenase family protein [Pseudomonas abietaniphila]SDI96010.1 NADPH:quinone reductase [Pseudomonas abietaniphila]
MQMSSMRAAILETYDSQFRYASVALPVPQPGEVLVKIVSSGVNSLDLAIRSGKAPYLRHALPAILGSDFAGIVVGTGSAHASFRPGDEVYGMTGGVAGIQGTLAEYACIDARLLALKPTNLCMREAAALPMPFISAWEGLVERAGLQSSQTLLIQGGSSDVGHLAIQIANALGAKVFATETPDRLHLVEDSGATAINSDCMTVEEYVSQYTRGRGFDIVYDTIGGESLNNSFRAVRQKGHVISTLGWREHCLASLSVRGAIFSAVFPVLPLLSGEGKSHLGEMLREASRLVESGLLLPRMDARRFGLQSVDEAHAAFTDGAGNGKLIIDIGI